MPLCSACQGLLSRIILYQLGRVSNVPNIYGDEYGDGRKWRGTNHCLICRVFTTHLSTKAKLKIRRCEESLSTAKDDSASVQVALGDGSESEVGLTIDLLNALELLEKLAQRPGVGELSVDGPILTHPNLIDQVEKYETISRASKWLRECDSCHAHSKSISSSCTPLPARVLDVTRNSDYDIVRLISGDIGDGRYAALSYCWGTKPLLTTTTTNLEDHKTGIPLARLSPLIQDAIYVTRELGLKFLWIDALCIPQDDLEEWHSIASEMETIFRNAYVTLAATAAQNTSQKIMPIRMKAKLKFEPPATEHDDVAKTSVTYFFSLQQKASPVRDILRAPLNSRAWVLQELMLSQRTIHFSKDQIFWHCKELAASADGTFSNQKGVMSDLGWYYGPDVVLEPATTPVPENRKPIRNYEVRRLTWHSPKNDGPKSIEITWWRLVEDYSGRKLTHISDKLIALSGIVDLMEKMKHDRYFAGMWENDLPESLLWYIDGSDSEAAILSGLPSWSWVSMDCPVRMPRFYRSGGFYPLVKVLSIEVVKSGSSAASTVTGGMLKLSGDVIALDFEYTGGAKSIIIRLFRITNQDGKSSRRHEGSATLDTELHNIGSLDRIWGLPIGYRQGELNVLLVKKVEAEDETYRRLGTGYLSTTHINLEYFETKHAGKRTISLI